MEQGVRQRERDVFCSTGVLLRLQQVCGKKEQAFLLPKERR